MQRLLFVTTLAEALGSGLVAGTLFAFSTSVMGALGRLPAAQGIAAMQAINVVILNRWFLGVFLGAGAVALLLAVQSVLTLGDPAARYRLAGSIAYIVGVILLTRGWHVPRNVALGALRPDSAEAALYWTRYLAEWIPWNHVRAAAALVSSALMILSLTASRPGGASVPLRLG